MRKKCACKVHPIYNGRPIYQVDCLEKYEAMRRKVSSTLSRYRYEQPDIIFFPSRLQESSILVQYHGTVTMPAEWTTETNYSRVQLVFLERRE